MKSIGSYGLSTHSHKHCVSEAQRPHVHSRKVGTGYSQTHCCNAYTLLHFHKIIPVVLFTQCLEKLIIYLCFSSSLFISSGREKKIQALVIIISNTVIKQSCLNPVLPFRICYSIPVTPRLQRSEFHHLLKGASLQFHILKAAFSKHSQQKVSSEHSGIECNFHSSVSPHHRALRSAEAFKLLHKPWVQCIQPCHSLQCQPACLEPYNSNQLDKLPGDRKSQMHSVLLPADFFFLITLLKSFS